jgi:hydrogenase maturation factor
VPILISDVNIVVSLLFLLSCVSIGNYVLLNLFLAILLDKFDSMEQEEDLEAIENLFDDVEGFRLDSVLE